MKFLADECCDLSTVDLLREEGHDVFYIPENEPGISDSDVLLKAFKQDRIPERDCACAIPHPEGVKGE